MGRAFAVLGMHRSGTSSVSGLMGLLGAHLGRRDLLGYPAFDNPKGYFEFNPFVHANETMFKRVDAAWDRIPLPMPDWSDDQAFGDMKQFVLDKIQKQFSASDVWAFKDPRCCITLPFWRSVIPSLEAILVLRNPLEVADSLASRNGLPFGRSLWLWTTYVLGSIRGSAGLRRHPMFYEDLLVSPKSEVKRLLEFSGLPNLPAGRWEEITSFLERDLRHHHRSAGELYGRKGFPAKAVNLYRALRDHVDLAKRGDAEDAALDRIAAEL